MFSVKEDSEDSSTEVIEVNSPGIYEFGNYVFDVEIIDVDDSKENTYPNKKMWEAFVSAGLPIVIGQDAHAPEEMNDIGYERAREFLNDLGGTFIEI